MESIHQAANDTKTMGAIRATLARVAAHPSLIEANIRNGMVTLSGPIFDHEVQPIVEAVGKISGVMSVDHRFNVMFASRETLMHHNAEDHFGYQSGYITNRQTHWLRILEGISGVLLLIQGLRKKDALGLFSSGIGALIAARAISNQDITHLVGNLILPVMRLRRTIYVSASIEEVYDFWAHFENYPRFMSFIRDVSISDAENLRWTVKAPGGIQVHWDTAVLDRTTNQRIAWKSVPGSLITTEGRVEFKPIEAHGVQINIELSFALPAGVLGYAVAHILGFDPRERIDEDLEVMKLLIEQQAPIFSHG